MGKIVQVQLGEYRPVTNFDLNHVDCRRHDYVIVDVDRGSEFGRVISDVEVVKSLTLEQQTAVSGKILRKATDGDLKQIENNRRKVKDALSTCIQKISERKIDMQVVKGEYTFDSSKIIFSFIAEGRVDFRSLVKDLARLFRVRIELRQIGVRDRSKIIGGYGVCGRELCCTSYINSFETLSIKMAKEQGLPLNPSRISGVCGRIKCCMAYEFLVYKECAKTLPHIGERIETAEGKGKVVDLNILKRIVSVDIGEGKIVRSVIPPLNKN